MSRLLHILFVITVIAGYVQSQSDKHFPMHHRVAEAPSATSASGKWNLRVLYAGNPRTARSKEFVGFLGEHFREVKKVDMDSFDAGNADVDVVILDYHSAHTREALLTDGYSRPTVTTGWAGAKIPYRRTRELGYI